MHDMGAHGTATNYSPMTATNNKKTDVAGQAKGRGCCGRTLKCTVVLVLLIGIFLYSAQYFTASKIHTKDGDAQSWSLDVDSFQQTKIIIDSYRADAELDTNYKHNQSNQLPADSAQPDQVEHVQVIRVTGPYRNVTGPGKVDNGDFPTVFSTLHSTFADLHLGKNNLIPTAEFLHISTDLHPLLAAVGSSISLIENDIKGNAKKLMKVYEENPTECATIQDMVLFDIKRGRKDADKGSVVSLKWYKRAYEFLARFMTYTVEGAEPPAAAKTAYDEVLGKYHNIFIRTSFKFGMNILPSRHNFFRNLVRNKEDLKRPNFEEKVLADIKNYLKSMRHVFSILREFFTENNLEN